MSLTAASEGIDGRAGSLDLEVVKLRILQSVFLSGESTIGRGGLSSRIDKQGSRRASGWGPTGSVRMCTRVGEYVYARCECARVRVCVSVRMCAYV